MAILKSFLCLCNTRTGSLISGCYTLTISLVCLVYYLFRYVGHKLVEDSAEYKGIIYVGFVLYGFMIVSSLVIIPGVQLDKRYLLLPWIYIIILMVLYDTGSVALLTTVHMEREKTLHVWEIIWVFFYLFRLAANCYCFTCVVSQYQELSDGRGTYDYLYKPRRRARLRNGTQFDLDTYDLPFGVHLPPYVEQDSTENNPPAYETIYPTSEIIIANDTEHQQAEIEINQSAVTLNEFYRHISCQSYPLPSSENFYHSNHENIEEISENTLPNPNRINDINNMNVNQQLERHSVELHDSSLSRPSPGYHDNNEVFHYPHCPHHQRQLHLHPLHELHCHHLYDYMEQHRHCHNNPTEIEGTSLGHTLASDNQGFNRDSQCYEVTVNVEWI